MGRTILARVVYLPIVTLARVALPGWPLECGAIRFPDRWMVLDGSPFFFSFSRTCVGLRTNGTSIGIGWNVLKGPLPLRRRIRIQYVEKVGLQVDRGRIDPMNCRDKRHEFMSVLLFWVYACKTGFA
ncbi:hypothetical protein BJV78DRAFT_452636 [Lactifluus subvellereus]|nr:hypothetical protein BJV78DRAFT_452636 [Lactifluus subvellereus]